MEEKESEKKSTKKTVIYIILRILIIIVMMIQIVHKDWNSVFMCALAFILFMTPSMIEKQMKVTLPNTLEVIILLFIFLVAILGEVQRYYVIFTPWRWDDMLHTANGFLCAAIGFALIDILNRSESIPMNLAPKFVAIAAFCFSMTVGVLWECFEFFMDFFTASDMQKDMWITMVNSAALNPNHASPPVHIPIESVVINGKTWPAYLDIGLFDTMQDLFVNFIGAVVFSVIGLFCINRSAKGRSL